jgi:hypothetical protein
MYGGLSRELVVALGAVRSSVELGPSFAAENDRSSPAALGGGLGRS